MDSDSTIDRDSILSESNEKIQTTMDITENSLELLMGTTLESDGKFLILYFYYVVFFKRDNHLRKSRFT